MDSVFLPVDQKPAQYPYFPDPALLVIWRNWGSVAPAAIAKAIGAEETDVRKLACKMGLDPEPVVSPLWKRQDFLQPFEATGRGTGNCM